MARAGGEGERPGFLLGHAPLIASQRLTLEDQLQPQLDIRTFPSLGPGNPYPTSQAKPFSSCSAHI